MQPEAEQVMWGVPEEMKGLPFLFKVWSSERPVLEEVSIRQHTSAYVSIRQQTSAYVTGVGKDHADGGWPRGRWQHSLAPAAP